MSPAQVSSQKSKSSKSSKSSNSSEKKRKSSRDSIMSVSSVSSEIVEQTNKTNDPELVVEEKDIEILNFNDNPAPVENTETYNVLLITCQQYLSLKDNESTVENNLELLRYLRKLYKYLENESSNCINQLEKLYKKSKKNKPKKTNKTVNHKLYTITDDFAEMLGLEKNTEMSRPDVIRSLHSYINNNSLRCQDNKNFFTTTPQFEKVIGEPSTFDEKTNQNRHSIKNIMSMASLCFVKNN